MKRRRIQLTMLLIWLAILSAASAHAAGPNIVVVMVDDMPAHMLAQMPLTRNAIGGAGVTFNQAFTEFSLCCPSRVTFLLGQYAHNHHVESNIAPRGGFQKFRPLQGQTIAVRLQGVGYRTAMIGKYVNQYPSASDPLHVPPGWNHWVALLRNPSDPITNSPINRNGVRGNLSGYQTDALATEARNFITEAVTANASFFVWLSFSAPHMPATPASRHANLFASARAPRTAAFNETDVSDKPALLQFPSLSSAQIAEADDAYRRQLRSLQAVDEAVRGLRNHLQSLGELGSTYIFFVSDNGFHNGEHRMPIAIGGGKQFAYEVDLRIPLLVRGPGVVNRANGGHMVVNVDLAPTIMAIAGLTSAAGPMDGRSLLPLLRGQTPSNWRRSFPIVKYVDPNQTQFPGYIGVRTTRYTWVEWANGQRELYDHVQDPQNLANLASASNLAGVRTTLSSLARRLSTCAGNSCRSIENSAPVSVLHGS
jgi:N-acetylglucosamine-6-sulfatase